MSASNNLVNAIVDTPQIYSTSEWGASDPHSPVSVLAERPIKIIIHHTTDPNSQYYSQEHAFQLARDIQASHFRRGWTDTGQHFTVSRGGYILEGRHRSLETLRGGTSFVLGAHCDGQNSEAVGIENEGTYIEEGPPERLWEKLVDLCAYICTQYGIEADQIYGHRDFNATECPGDRFYAMLDSLRSDVEGRLHGLRLDVVALGEGNQLYQKYYIKGRGWSEWVNLGAPSDGLALSDPAICSWEASRLDIFARATSNQLVHKWFAGGWSDWEDLGGILTSGPAAAAWEPRRLDIVALGEGPHLIHKWFNGSEWLGWEDLGAPPGGLGLSDPAICSWEARRLDIFARGANNELVHKWFSGNKWSGWESLGGTFTSGIAATAWEPGRIDVVVRGEGNRLFHKWYASTWSGWQDLGAPTGGLTSDPAICSWEPRRLDIFARGANNQLVHKWFASDRWSDWEDLEGILTSGPDATSQR